MWTSLQIFFVWMVAKGNSKTKPIEKSGGNQGRKSESYLPFPPRSGSKVNRGKEKVTKPAEESDGEGDDAIFDLDIGSDEGNGDSDKSEEGEVQFIFFEC